MFALSTVVFSFVVVIIARLVALFAVIIPMLVLAVGLVLVMAHLHFEQEGGRS